MVWFWSIAAVMVVSFAAEYFLSYRANRWHGLILPAVYLAAAGTFVLLNLLQAFPDMQTYGLFLAEYGGAGFFAAILKIGFVLFPVAVYLVIYRIRRHQYAKTHQPAKHNKEYKKMLADDL